MQYSQFGPLTTTQSINKYFNAQRSISRRQLLSELYRKSNLQYKVSPKKLQQDLTQAFMVLLNNYTFKSEHPIVQRIMSIFDLKYSQLEMQNPTQRMAYIKQKILSSIQTSLKIQQQPDKQFAIDFNRQNTDISTLSMNSYCASNPQRHTFQWVGATSNFKHLQPIYEQILLQKVRLFDNELTNMIKFQNQAKKNTQQLIKTTRSFSTLPSKVFSRTNRTVNIRKKQLARQLQQEGFCDVLIRDKSQFSLTKWTKSQEKQFKHKKQDFKNTFHKDDQTPIIFQFVKKYTTTLKARDNIYKKWEERQKNGISAEELRYLCATSLFLNQTIAKSQQHRIKKNIDFLGKNLLSKLQFNIAQKIIETYKTFMKKVADLRAQYYQQLTEDRKKQYNLNKKKNKQLDKKLKSKQQFLKYKAMFTRVCNSERMKIKLNFKVYRWVKLFMENLKKKVNSKKIYPVNKDLLMRLSSTKGLSTYMIANFKKRAPSSKIIKRQDHTKYRLHHSKIPQDTQRFYYQPYLQKKINQINSVRVKDNTSYRSQLSGGPNNFSSDKIYINNYSKEIVNPSKKCIKAVIMIQKKWKCQFQKKRFKAMIQQKRKIQQIDFESKKILLYSLYPLGKKIDFKAIISRLKRVSMRTLSVFRPYERSQKKPINNFTSFCTANLSLNQLKAKNAKNSSRRLAEFVKYVENNQFIKLRQNGYVLTSKQINQTKGGLNANAMWWATKNSNNQLCKKLLEGGGDPNSTDQNGNTCLHVALKNGDIEICFQLLDYGADLNMKNKDKVTPLFFATTKMQKFLGLQQGSVAANTQSLQDNNSMFFMPKSKSNSRFYEDHIY